MSKQAIDCVEGSSGFTLIELLVGLAILSAVVLVALPVTSSARSSQAITAAASELAATARMTRAAAVRSGVERTLVIATGEFRYWADGVTGPRALPPRMSWKLAVPSGEAAPGTLQKIRFLPGGSSSGASIILNDGRRSSTITIDWLTGGAHVHQ